LLLLLLLLQLLILLILCPIIAVSLWKSICSRVIIASTQLTLLTLGACLQKCTILSDVLWLSGIQTVLFGDERWMVLHILLLTQAVVMLSWRVRGASLLIPMWVDQLWRAALIYTSLTALPRVVGCVWLWLVKTKLSLTHLLLTHLGMISLVGSLQLIELCRHVIPTLLLLTRPVMNARLLQPMLLLVMLLLFLLLLMPLLLLLLLLPLPSLLLIIGIPFHEAINNVLLSSWRGARHPVGEPWLLGFTWTR